MIGSFYSNKLFGGGLVYSSNAYIEKIFTSTESGWCKNG